MTDSRCRSISVSNTLSSDKMMPVDTPTVEDLDAAAAANADRPQPLSLPLLLPPLLLLFETPPPPPPSLEATSAGDCDL